jgi:polyferredoxin
MSNLAEPSALSRIPVKVVGGGTPPADFHRKRRAVQFASIALAILIPATGLFRIDPAAGAMVIFDRQIWFSDFFLVAGFWILLASAMVMLYSVAGTVFCAWVCPQNSLAEWANKLTHRLLGKRANVSLEGDAPIVAAAKDKLLNWLLLACAFLAAAMFFALIPLFYFYPPDVVWSFITLRADDRLAPSLHYIYGVCVLIVLLDIAVIRHFWCRFACIYRVWQHSFKTKQTLHIAYDRSRSDECERCNYCVSACFIDLDPRQTAVYDSCINCGECVDACDRIHAKEAVPGLLRFELGERAGAQSKFRTAAVSLASRMRWVAALASLGAAASAWGFWTYEPYHLAVYRSEQQSGPGVHSYRIAVSNKLYRSAKLSVRIRGLDPRSYRLSSEDVSLTAAGRDSVILSLSPDMPHGLHSFFVDASAPGGWKSSFQVQHFSEKES